MEKLTSKQLYDRDETKVFTFRVVKNTEADIIEKLESVPNKAGYIKSLIRADIKKGILTTF